MSPTRRILAGMCCGVLLVPAAPITAQNAQDNPPAVIPDGGVGDGREQVRGDELTPETRVAIDKGLEWLAPRQGEDGSFGGSRNGTAYTALAALAFMSAGHLPNRGKYGQNVARAVDFVIASSQPSGLLCEEDASGLMYHHGFATLLLGEVYGMTGDERIKEPLRRAVALIEQSQNSQGGWRYQPVPVDADVSVTICQVMGLRAARDAGIQVERQVIDNAIEYVRRCQNPDGGFNYMLGTGNNSAFARSAAGVATLYYAGISEGEDIDQGLGYVMRHIPGAELRGRQPHYFYGQYYAAQATFLAGGDYWAQWYPAIRDELVETQSEDGHWETEPGQTSEYCTAMALIVLQMPNRYLPVFSGKGQGS